MSYFDGEILIICIFCFGLSKFSHGCLWSWQLKRSPPRHPPRATLKDERPKARPKRQLHDDDAEDADAISMIRKMFR